MDRRGDHHPNRSQLRGALFYQAPNGQVTTYPWKVSGDDLTISGSGINQVFRRATEAAASPDSSSRWPPAGRPPSRTADAHSRLLAGRARSGVSLMPASRLEEFSAGADRGLAGELGGMAQNGPKLTARVIGVLTPFGDAAVFLGVTTPEQYAQHKPRVDALAASAAFVKPKIPPANATVAG